MPPPARGEVVDAAEPPPEGRKARKGRKAERVAVPPAPLEELVHVAADRAPVEPAPARPASVPAPAPAAPLALPAAPGGPFGAPVHVPGRTVVPVVHEGAASGWIEVDEHGSRFVAVPAPPRDLVRAALAGAAMALGGAAVGALLAGLRGRRR